MRLLAAVADRGSVSAAAETVGISQPAASRRLHAIQSRVGVRLFHFGPRGATLTEAGLFWTSEIRRLLGGLDDAQSRFATTFHLRKGLYFAASHVVADSLVPRWLAGWQRPSACSVSVITSNSPAVLELVVAAKVDFGVVEIRDEPPPELSSVQLCCDRLVLVVSSGHPWARVGCRVTAQLMAQTPLIHRESNSGAQQAWMRYLAKVGPGVAPPMLEVDSLAAVKMAAAAGVAPAILPRLAVEEELRTGRLREVAVDGLELDVWVYAIWLPATELSSVARSFLDHLRSSENLMAARVTSPLSATAKASSIRSRGKV